LKKAKTEEKTPGEMGFRMPAEWERHEGTWLGWPHELTDWPGKFAPIPWAFAEMVRVLSEVEKIFLMVQDRAAEKRVRGILRKAEAKLDALPVIITHGWPGSVIEQLKISLPVAITVFPEDVYRGPETWARRAYRNLIYFHEVDKGGHFAAWEQPELFAAEIRAAFKSLRPADAKVAGR